MDREAEFDQVLGLIYESTLAPAGLPEALAAMTRLLHGDTCHLVGWERNSGIPSLSISTGLLEMVGPEYATHYAHIDPGASLHSRRSQTSCSTAASILMTASSAAASSFRTT